uniref:Uncharacterized protein n=1 Tax=viral metagenome TaxID=1070528 RepID=A0A6M3LJA5_9ZZZZ
MIPRILIEGYSQTGKTEAGKILAKIYQTNGPANTGDYILLDWCEANEVNPVDVTHLWADPEEKDKYRLKLYDFGNKVKAADPSHYALQCLGESTFVTGVRTPLEFAATRAYFDACLWITRPGYGPRESDECMDKNWGDFEIVATNLQELERKIRREFIPFLSRPLFYIIGRYRHYNEDGSLNENAMEYERQDEIKHGQLVYKHGGRPFLPANIFRPLDNWNPDDTGEQRAKRILDLCDAQICRIPRESGGVLVRDYWWKLSESDSRPSWYKGGALPESRGSRREIMLANSRRLRVIFSRGEENGIEKRLIQYIGRMS